MLFWFETHSNNVESSLNFVYLLSSKSSRGSGLYVDRPYIKTSIALFSVRCLVKQNWVNDQNRYLTPSNKGIRDDLLV